MKSVEDPLVCLGQFLHVNKNIENYDWNLTNIGILVAWSGIFFGSADIINRGILAFFSRPAMSLTV